MDHPRHHLFEIAAVAAQRSLIDFRHSGGVTDVGFTELLRPMGRPVAVSLVGDLLKNYERFVQLPWPSNLAPAQRVWMAVYRPEEERRLRLHIEDFEIVSRKAGHEWDLIDISDEFEALDGFA